MSKVGSAPVRGKLLRRFAVNPESWRPDLLALLLKASLLLSAVVFLPSLYFALTVADFRNAVADIAIVVGALALVFLQRLAFPLRAAAFCLASYMLGAWLMVSTGSTSEVYFLAFSILTTLLFGLRPGLLTVVLNSMTLVLGGYLGYSFELDAAGSTRALEVAGWPVLDFLLIDTLLTLAIGAVLTVVESSMRREQVEQVLRNSERRFRALIEHSSDCVALIDANNTIIYLSPSVTAVEGYTPEELIGRNGIDHTHPDDAPLLAEIIRELVAHPGQPFPALWRRRHKNGYWIWLEGVATNLLDDPAVGAIVTNYRDVTQRLMDDAALRESEDRLRLLHNLSEATRAVASPDEIVATSLRVLGEHLGASRCAYGDMDADGVSLTVPHDYTNGCASVVGRYRLADFGARTVTELRRGNTLVVRDVQRELSPEDGATAYAAIDIHAMICCSLVRNGAFRAVIAVHQSTPRDWTAAEIDVVQAVAERCWAAIEGRKSEQKLRASEQHLRAVIDTTPECVTLISHDGLIIETNTAGLAIKEIDDAADAVGMSMSTIVAPEDRERVRAFHEAVCGGRGGRLTYDLIGLRGTRRTVETISAPLQGADGRMLHLAITRDSTETRRLEEQLRQAQKMEAVGQLAGGIAHDFNNLLTIVIGYCDILAEKNVLAPPDRVLLDEVRRSGERAASLTRQLLAFSRKQVLEPRVLNLNSIVGDMDRMLRRLIGENIRLTSRLDRTLWPVKVDAGQIEQVIVNLVVNARDAMPGGGDLIIETANVDLTEDQCRSHSGRAPGRYTALCITDTGQGMPLEVQQRIFEPFFTTKEAGKGTGLGLSVVDGIVKQSEGFVDVRSEVGAGTSFLVYFPAVDGLVEYGVAGIANGALPRGTETVLLVEDEDAVRHLLRRTLEAQGYTVLEAANGSAAIATAAAHGGAIGLVVSDVVMPTMSGGEMAEQLRARLPELKVLFISGYTDDEVVRHGIVDASYAFLQKPFTPHALARKVRELLDGKLGRHLLFVDDEAPLVYLATRELEEHGYRVSGCASPTEALASFKRDPTGFDLVVTDSRMREMSGLDLARQLRALRPDLPIIVASGAVDDELRSHAAEIGVNVVLAKPSTIEQFGAAIHAAAAKLP